MILRATESAKSGQLVSFESPDMIRLSRQADDRQAGVIIGMTARDISEGEIIQYSPNQNTDDVLVHVNFIASTRSDWSVNFPKIRIENLNYRDNNA